MISGLYFISVAAPVLIGFRSWHAYYLPAFNHYPGQPFSFFDWQVLVACFLFNHFSVDSIMDCTSMNYRYDPFNSYISQWASFQFLPYLGEVCTSCFPNPAHHPGEFLFALFLKQLICKGTLLIVYL